MATQTNKDGDTYTPTDRIDEAPLVIISQGDKRREYTAEQFTNPLSDLINNMLLAVGVLMGSLLILWIAWLLGAAGVMR